MAVLAALALGVGTVVVLTRHDAAPHDDSGGSAAVTAVTTAAAADERDGDLSAAHTAYLAGGCDEAVSLYDQLLADSEWVGSSDSVAQARNERDECAEFLAISTGTRTPAELLSDYVAFLNERPTTPLGSVVEAEIQRVYASDGAASLSSATCDALEGDFGRLTSSDVAVAMLGCADLYSAEGRNNEAASLAAESLQYTVDPTVTTRAIGVVVGAPGACSGMADGVSLVDVAQNPAQHAALLQACMAAAGAAGDNQALASLQVRYLIDLPDHPDAATVEAALIENAGACDLLWTMRDQLAGREGFAATKTLRCAELAHFFGDTGTAIELYRWFLDNTQDDPRAGGAEAGLAWNLIAQARANGTTEWERPGRSDQIGGNVARMIIRNDAWSALDVTLTGPETHFLTVAESPTSAQYFDHPNECRLDVPSITIDLTPGVYDVMFERNGNAAAVGTWDLRAGSVYDFCLYLVTI